MKNIIITEKDDCYLIMDSTTGQYANRAVGNPTQSWTSCWSKEFQFISLQLDREDLTDVILKKTNKHYDYNKAIRTKNRHLKALKEHLGVLSPKKEEKVTVFYRSRAGYSEMDNIRKDEVIIHDKIIEIDRIKYKKYAIDYVLLTEEKAVLVDEYNRKLAEFKAFKKEMLQQIFDDDEI